jgi:ubiquinone/menaquinone biosynthesis C-methylase UbiE
VTPDDQWQELAPRWERSHESLWESTRVVSAWLVERLDPLPGQTVLDVAAGTGETGFLAASRLGVEGRLIVGDRSPEMLGAAERVAAELGVTNAEFRVLDLDRLDLDDASVDGALCRFGYVLKGERRLSELRRVLRPGGRLAFAVWAARERNDWMTIPTEVMVARGHLQPQTDADVRVSERRNPASIERLARSAGFAEVEVEEQQVAYRFADAGALWRFVSEVRGPVAIALDSLPEDERALVRAEIEQRTPRAGDGYELGGVSINVCAS